MFESIKHWFESLKEESKLFDHRDDEILHSALASVLYHVISADQRVDSRERHEFDRLLKQEFDLNDKQVEHLYQGDVFHEAQQGGALQIGQLGVPFRYG